MNFLKKHGPKVFNFLVIVGAAVVTEIWTEKQRKSEIEEITLAVMDAQKALEMKED